MSVSYIKVFSAVNKSSAELSITEYTTGSFVLFNILVHREGPVSQSIVCRTNLTCTKYVLHTLSILQHVSTHNTCRNMLNVTFR